MKFTFIRLLAIAVFVIGVATSAHSQDALPINAAASVNGFIISNDTVEQGIQAAV
jgi:peptidyl-prolyl cis-trans isomerase C